MQFGVGLPNYSRGASVQGVNEVAHAADELGYDSVWTTDHMLVPKEHAEVFGYVLTPDTKQQKIAMLVGPKRSGKGLIGRILRRLVGERNTCSPTLAASGSDCRSPAASLKLKAARSN